jgi:hypothetical protein
LRPKLISFFQIDVGSSGLVSAESVCSGSGFGSLRFRPNEISFFQIDCSSTA